MRRRCKCGGSRRLLVLVRGRNGRGEAKASIAVVVVGSSIRERETQRREKSDVSVRVRKIYARSHLHTCMRAHVHACTTCAAPNASFAAARVGWISGGMRMPPALRALERKLRH